MNVIPKTLPQLLYLLVQNMKYDNLKVSFFTKVSYLRKLRFAQLLFEFCADLDDDLVGFR